MFSWSESSVSWGGGKVWYDAQNRHVWSWHVPRKRSLIASSISWDGVCFAWGLSPGDPVITLDAFGPYPLHRIVRWYISQANDLRPEAREWSRDDPLRWYKTLLIDSTSRGISLLTSTLRFISLFVRFQGIIYLFIKTTSIDQKETD